MTGVPAVARPVSPRAAAEYPDLDPAIALPLAAGVNNQVLFTGEALLMGWCIWNNDTGAAHQLSILDGQDANGTLIVPVRTNAGLCDHEALSWPYLGIRSGIYIVATAADFSGSIWIIPL